MLVSVTALTSASTKRFVSQDFLKCEKSVFLLRFAYLIRFFASVHFMHISQFQPRPDPRALAFVLLG